MPRMWLWFRTWWIVLLLPPVRTRGRWPPPTGTMVKAQGSQVWSSQAPLALDHSHSWGGACEWIGYAYKLLEKMKLLMSRNKISSPSVKDCRRWLKKCGRSKLYNNTTLMLQLLRNIEPPPGPCAIGRAKVMFCRMLRIWEKLGLGGNRCYNPFYIYKIFDEILEGDQRRVLSYIHL